MVDFLKQFFQPFLFFVKLWVVRGLLQPYFEVLLFFQNKQIFLEKQNEHKNIFGETCVKLSTNKQTSVD